MGSYTANYQLYLAAAAEQGWGDLVNGNFETIDSILKTVSNTATSAKTAAENADSKAEVAAKTAQWSQISGKPTYVMGLTRKDITIPTSSYTTTVNGLNLGEVTITFQVSITPDASNDWGDATLTVTCKDNTYTATSRVSYLNWKISSQTSGTLTIPAMEYIKSITVAPCINHGICAICSLIYPAGFQFLFFPSVHA